MKTNIREIPYSARRYFISENGTVYTKDGEIIEKYLVDNHYHVRLVWINGDAEYKVATLMLLTYKTLSLPDHLLESVEPLYADGDCENLSSANILYRFKNGPLEVEGIKGFYYIPMFANYAINKDGEIINWRTRKYKSWSFTKPVPEKNSKGGYAYNRVINDENFSVTLFRHRAMCLVFNEYNHDVWRLVVNHKDGIPGNDWIDNLEWATHKENNIHAVQNGLRLDNKPVLSKNLRTGEILTFSSCNECARYFGHPQGNYIKDRIMSGKLYSDLMLFKYDDGSEWPNLNPQKDRIHIAKHSNTILARNVFTGQILIFNGTAKGNEVTGVKPATILKHAKEEMLIPVSGWNFRYGHKDIVWPKHTKRHLKIYEKYPIYPPDGLIARNNRGEEVFFESMALAAQKLKIGKHVIVNAIRYNKITLDDGWSFEVFDIRKNLSHPTE